MAESLSALAAAVRASMLRCASAIRCAAAVAAADSSSALTSVATRTCHAQGHPAGMFILKLDRTAVLHPWYIVPHCLELTAMLQDSLQAASHNLHDWRNII